jgi:hypothetical protein
MRAKKQSQHSLSLLWLFIVMTSAFLLLLLTRVAEADEPITGFIEGRRYLSTNLPAYPDLTGQPMKYGVNFQLNFPTFVPHVQIMAGADSATNSHQFAQIAGRFGASYTLNALEVSLYHRSNHAIDHTPVDLEFLSENRLNIKYNFVLGK